MCQVSDLLLQLLCLLGFLDRNTILNKLKSLKVAKSRMVEHVVEKALVRVIVKDCGEDDDEDGSDGFCMDDDEGGGEVGGEDD